MARRPLIFILQFPSFYLDEGIRHPFSFKFLFQKENHTICGKNNCPAYGSGEKEEKLIAP